MEFNDIRESKSCFLAVDAIAVRVLDKNTVISGVGNELHLFCSTSPPEVLPYKLHGKVHGIERGVAENASKVLVYGEKEFMLLHWSVENNFKLLHRSALTDWISAGKWMSQAHEFVLLTAHSIAIRFRLDTDQRKCNVVEKSSCTDKSTLYCSHLHGPCWEKLSIFGGNAFGELLVWQPTVTATAVEGERRAVLQQRKNMHNGVIFSIDYDEEAHLLITTSDDRSIKFWQAAPQEVAGWRQTQFNAIACGYGHVARVFQGKLVRDGSALYAITSGEDSYVCVWRCDSGELLHKCRQQFGATVWHLDYEPHTKTLYTAGSTGNVLATDLADIWPADDGSAHAHDVQTLRAVHFDSEYVAKIKFLTDQMLIGVTNRNRLVYKRLPGVVGADNELWQLVGGLPTDYQPYKCTVLEVHRQRIAMCGHKRLTLLQYDVTDGEPHFSTLYDGAPLDGVIRALQFLDEDRCLVSDETGACLLLAGAQLQQRHAIALPPCKEPWLTTALEIGHDWLLASNRQGNLLAYRYEATTTSYTLCDTLRQPHGNLGATVLRLLELTERRAFVQSAGRDGTVKRLCLQLSNGRLAVHARTNVPIPWVEHIVECGERCCCAGAAPLLIGFNDNHLVAWSEAHDVAWQVACGGGHRCWHYAISEGATTRLLQLVFVQHRQVRWHRLKLVNTLQSRVRLPSRNRWHVKACNVATTLSSAAVAAAGATLLISAGDDNLIKIASYSGDKGALQQRAEVHTHISNVRALKTLQVRQHTNLLFSGGGRGQLCITQLCTRTCTVRERLNYTLQPKQRAAREAEYNFDPETRIMALDAAPSAREPYRYDVYLGCSDGHVRQLQLKLNDADDGHDDGVQVQLGASLYYGQCVLQLCLVGDRHVALAGTDGIIRLYDRELRDCQLQLPHHASGVNALDLLLIADGDSSEPTPAATLHVLSGGDDQLVVHSQVLLALTMPPQLQQTIHYPRLHTAQVTSVRLCRGQDARLIAYTCGVDQQLCRVDLQAHQLQRQWPVCVADVKGVCLNGRTCFIYGCGLQIQHLT